MMDSNQEFENSSVVNPPYPNVSSIEKGSFLEGCPKYGNPLHSTALEEDHCPRLKHVQQQEVHLVNESRMEKKPRQKKAITSDLGRTEAFFADSHRSQKLSVIPRGTSSGQRVSSRPTALELVLKAFLELCSQHGESVESKAQRKAVDDVSSCFMEQLTEKIVAAKKLRVLKQENATVNVKINQKRVKLLEDKAELLLIKLKTGRLLKEKKRLDLQLADLRSGSAFLSDLTLVTNRYRELCSRQKHGPIEEYGSSSLPVLLLETEEMFDAEDNLRDMNNRLEEF